jgi:hypothetical protein
MKIFIARMRSQQFRLNWPPFAIALFRRVLCPFSNSRFRATLLSGSAQSLHGGAATRFPINLGESGSPEAEVEILRRVGSYGRQLGRISDVIIVLLRHLPNRDNLTLEERNTVAAFEEMANDIADIKEMHNGQAMRPERTSRSKK